MTDTNIVLLYVTNVRESMDFYSRILASAPVESSPTFALFILPSGLALGLWDKAGVKPAPNVPAGGSDLGFKVATPEAVDATCRDWQSKGAAIALMPTDLDFGRSFVATDPDGHRLRVYALGDEA